MEPVGLLVAEIDEGVVLNPGKVGTHVGRHVIVEVGWGDGDHLEVHPLTVHVRQPDRRLEDALGQGTEPLTARVAEIPATAVLDQLRTMVGMGRRHPGQSGGDDGVGVDIDRGQRRRGSIAIGTSRLYSGVGTSEITSFTLAACPASLCISATGTT